MPKAGTNCAETPDLVTSLSRNMRKTSAIDVNKVGSDEDNMYATQSTTPETVKTELKSVGAVIRQQECCSPIIYNDSTITLRSEHSNV